MAATITANGETMDWSVDTDLFDVFRILGYKLKVPVVLVRVDGEVIRKNL